MDSTLTAFITLFLVLQAATVRAGKTSMVSDELILTERGEKMEIEGSKDLPGNSHIASLPPTIDVSILQQQVLPHLIYLLD